MRKAVKMLCSLIAVCMVFSTLLFGCGKTEESTINESTVKNDSANSKVTEPEPPVKLTMLMSDAGIDIPDDVDVSNNPFVEVIEKEANVDLQITKPAYQDYKTKFNLLLSSGDLPDIVHNWFIGDVEKAGQAGAFAVLDDYITKSTVLSEKYDQKQIELMKASDGKIYYLQALPSGDINGTFARLDLINELNGGKVPETPDEWYELAKKVKQKYPESIPFCGHGGLSFLETFFRAYGAEVDSSGAGWQYTNGKYIATFEAPGMRDAVAFYRKLYAEKLLDPNFVTAKNTDAEDIALHKNQLISWNGPGSMLSLQTSLAKEGNPNALIGYVPWPKASDNLDPNNVYMPKAAQGAHNMAISSKCKNIDAAVRVLEAFVSDEIALAASWGREGIEYIVKDGKKVLNLDAEQKTSYRMMYACMFTYYYDDMIEVLRSRSVAELSPEMAKKFNDAWESGVKIRDQGANSSLAIRPVSFFPERPAEIGNAKSEALEASKSIILKAIIGEISMDDYDKQVKDWLAKYSYITEDYNTCLNDYNAKNKSN